jgi:tRNA(Ile)-lysidine synthase
MPLLAPVRAFTLRHGLLQAGDTVLVAVSGGQDSCALLHLLSRLRDELDLTLTAAHLNHGIRGEEADSDAEFVRDFAASLDVSCVVERADVPALKRKQRVSTQQAARAARHAFLEETAAQTGAGFIAFGHTADDRAETVLLNILRGTGVDGLGGMAPRAGRRIRPLLTAHRVETEAYCRAHGIAFRTDASNRSRVYARNWVREELLPFTESYLTVDVKQAVLRLSDLAAEDAVFLQQAAEAALQEVSLNSTPGCVVLSVERLTSLPISLRRRVVRAAILRVRGSLDHVEMASVERALEIARSGLGGETLAGGAITLTCRAGALRVERLPGGGPSPHVEAALPVPGEVCVSELGVQVRAAVQEAPENPRFCPDSTSVWMSLSALQPPLVVRSRRAGDRIRPIGLGGTRKVQDILTDRRVPAGERDRVPIVADQHGPVWVVGHVLSERARIGREETSALRLEVLALDGSN